MFVIDKVLFFYISRYMPIIADENKVIGNSQVSSYKTIQNNPCIKYNLTSASDALVQIRMLFSHLPELFDLLLKHGF